MNSYCFFFLLNTLKLDVRTWFGSVSFVEFGVESENSCPTYDQLLLATREGSHKWGGYNGVIDLLRIAHAACVLCHCEHRVVGSASWEILSRGVVYLLSRSDDCNFSS